MWIHGGSLGAGRANADGLELDELADAQSEESDSIFRVSSGPQ